MPKEKIILGIDPGLADTGYGIIKQQNGRLTAADYGNIKTVRNLALEVRLKKISHSLDAIVKKYRPDIAAVEELFFCKNVKTALAVGQARGAVLLTLSQKNIPIVEFTPLQIKQALTSYGRADKKQVQQMVKIILRLETIPKPDDAADALAAAVCCAHTLWTKK